MNAVTNGARSFSPPPKARQFGVSGGEWPSYQQPAYGHKAHFHEPHHDDSEPDLLKKANKMPMYGYDEPPRRADLSKLYEEVPETHKSFLDPEYEAEMLRHKRAILQSVVDSNGMVPYDLALYEFC